MSKKMFEENNRWEAERIVDLTRSRTTAWRVVGLLALLLAITIIALASMVPFRRTIPYLVKVDTQTGNVEVLQSFDNRMVGKQELMDKHWASKYVLSREQYNWQFIGGDYDFVSRTTDPQILPEYANQFQGPSAMDKVFGEFTERRINIVSVTPAPTVRNQMVVRFERTTVQKGVQVEPPSMWVVNLAFRYKPKTIAPEVDLIRNPQGFQVHAYRRDAEVGTATQPQKPTGGAL